jgi:hypothetical protein
LTLDAQTALAARTGLLFPTTTNVPVGANISSTASARFNGDIARVSVNYKID